MFDKQIMALPLFNSRIIFFLLLMCGWSYIWKERVGTSVIFALCCLGADGRAGMAAILLKDTVEFHTDLLPQIFHHCEENLPVYARPLFLRFIKEMPLTTTHKQKKVQYVKEGYNPAIISDPLYRVSAETKTYIPLTTENVGQFMAKSRL